MKPTKGGRYRLLTHAAVRKIHDSSLELLIDVGLEVHSDKAWDVFEKAGALTESEKRIVKLPYAVVQNCLQSTPKEIVLYGREDQHNLYCTGKNVYLGTGGIALYVIDLHTNRHRKAILKDVRNISRLIDALEHVHFNLIPVYPNDLPLKEVDINRFFGAVSNTTKHVMGGVFTIDGARKVMQMAAEIAGGMDQLRKRPFISFISCVMSPLKIDRTYGDLVVEVAREGLPLAVPAEPLTGLTAPITLAGTLTALHAETLAKIVLAQLVNPGTPIMYACTASSTDPRTMRYITGSVEMGLLNAAATQMAQYLNLPNYTTAGMSDSKAVDAQNGYEKAISSLMVALAGSNFIHDTAGLVEFAMTASYKQYVVDNEINGMVMRAVQGIDVDDDTIALDLFRKVGPGGNFVAQRHTAKYVREEHFIPTLSDRTTRGEWAEKGRLDTEERAIELAKELLARHRTSPLPKELRHSLGKKFPELWT